MPSRERDKDDQESGEADAVAGALDGEADEDGLFDASGELLDPLGNKRRKKVPNLPALAGPRSTQGRGGGDLLTHYLSEIRRYALLDPEEERAVALRYYEGGDASAAERLVTANLRLVVKIAFQYHRQWSNVLDLIQEGNVGLVEALSRYDPYRGIRFSSYAQYWIRAMILRFLMDNFRLVRLGSTRNGRKLFFQLQKERERLLREGQPATVAQLAERLSVPESEIIAVDQHMRAPAMSLDAPASGDPEGRNLGDLVPDKDQQDPESQMAGTELGSIVREKLKAFAATLEDDRERAIWAERLVAPEPASLSDLGDRYDVSKERIRQIEVRVKKRLKLYLQQELGDEIAFEFVVPERE
ncbi:MAG: sigma-70 family RNA polymerase sigma factor [Myxococcales bacterium]|nr:sigma-70 family RNA polymerase sigma factor [Myxococcales bacterium]